MITKGLAGYRETAAKLDNQATLRERVDASLKTLSNRWDAASGSFTNAMAAIGETVAPVLKQVADWLGNLAGALGSFVKQHPQLTAALFKIAAGFAIVTAGIGAALLVFASTIGPMLLMRMLMNKTGLQAFSSFGLMRKAIGLVSNGVLWLGRLMMANPILAVIGLIAMGAIYIWQNWDTLGPKFAALWDGISTKVSNVWTAIRTYISTKWEEIVADVKALPARFQEAGSQMIDGLLAGISQKWDALKSKLSSLTDYLPDFLKPGNDKPGAPAQAARPRTAQVTADGKVALPPGGFPAFPRMYDTGGHIPSGQFGIVGENGPEMVNGPANITSRRRTAALAASAALAMGMAATPAAARPLHPMSQPAQAYRQESTRPQPAASMSPVTVNASITIMQQPGQSAQDVADEVMRRLEAKERQAKARARSSYHDREGIE